MAWGYGGELALHLGDEDRGRRVHSLLAPHAGRSMGAGSSLAARLDELRAEHAF